MKFIKKNIELVIKKLKFIKKTIFFSYRKKIRIFFSNFSYHKIWLHHFRKNPTTFIFILEKTLIFFITNSIIEITLTQIFLLLWNGLFDLRELIRFMVVGLWCCNPDCKQRPKIKDLIQILNIEAPLPWLPPRMPRIISFQREFPLDRSYSSEFYDSVPKPTTEPGLTADRNTEEVYVPVTLWASLSLLSILNTLCGCAIFHSEYIC